MQAYVQEGRTIELLEIGKFASCVCKYYCCSMLLAKLVEGGAVEGLVAGLYGVSELLFGVDICWDGDVSSIC
jgi:hypothetical protein